ncbi:hypothetical protein Tco_0032731 [Tanacetum coccineum]
MTARILENYNQRLILEFSLDMHRAEKVTESTTNEPDKSWKLFTFNSMSDEQMDPVHPVQDCSYPASSSGKSPYLNPTPIHFTSEHIGNGTDPHPLDNSIGDSLSTVSTPGKQLVRNALWCFLSIPYCQILELELVPPPDSAMIIALKWIYKVNLTEYGDVVETKARLVAKGLRQKKV